MSKITKKKPVEAEAPASKGDDNTYKHYITSDEFVNPATKKIDVEIKKCNLDKKGNAIKHSVVAVLKDFCKQNNEFSQAVEQTDKTVIGCIRSIVKDCGSCISDLEVFNRAVEFYFPGAKVKFTMTVDLGDEGFSNNPPVSAPTNEYISLSLDSLLDF